jgi:hypothetical protein
VDVFEVEGGHTHDYFLHGDADASGTVETPLKLSPIDTLLPKGMTWTPAPNGIDTGIAAKPHWAYGHLSNLKAGAASGTITASLKSSAGPQVTVTFLAEPGSRIITGTNPAVRGAKESDSQLAQYSRPFLMLRHEASNGRSRFVAVIGKDPVAIESSNLPGGGLAIKVKRAGKVDTIEYPSLRSTERLPLAAVESDAMVLNGNAKILPAPGETIRVVTADGWVYPFTVASAEQTANGLRMHVNENLALRFDRDTHRLSLLSYPRREHTGPVTVDWLAR